MASWLQQQLQQQLKVAENLLDAVDRTVSAAAGMQRPEDVGSDATSGAPPGEAHPTLYVHRTHTACKCEAACEHHAGQAASSQDARNK